ncbi:MAG TPA: hypothetical protein VKA44_01215 [Gemmatimonadota bacterium]|nr:hypothetical protein [Gemmatimonadota bacterium]
MEATVSRWKRFGPLLVLLTGGLAVGAPAAAQQGNAPAAQAELGAKLEQVRSSFGPSVSSQIETLLKQARSAGVPESLVLDKALEGAAKGVQGARVLDALRGYQARLARARDILGSSADGSLLVAGADALQKGVPAGAIHSVGAAGGRDPMALVALGDLIDAGVPADQAVGLVRKALDGGRRGDQLLDIPSRVRSLMRQGTPPGQAAEAVGKAIGQGTPPGGPPGERGARRGGGRGLEGGARPSGHPGGPGGRPGGPGAAGPGGG